MSETAVNITVDPATVNKIVTTQLQSAVAASLGKYGEQFIANLVQQACSAKVDSEGKPSRGYSSDTPFIEWASQKAIRDAVNEVVVAWVAEQKESIRKALVKQLSAGKNDLIRAMATSCAGAMIEGWRFTFNVQTNKQNT
jgi:hypothetical protein